jgi:hypothetical protein
MMEIGEKLTTEDLLSMAHALDRRKLPNAATYLRYAAQAIRDQQEEIARLREAVTKSAERFREYADEASRAVRRTGGAIPYYVAYETRNRELAEMCEAALARTLSQEGRG